MGIKKKSRYALHVERWADGCGSGLCETARNICFARGSIPCDILFIGEAPGESENVLGKPFKGPSGRILNNVIERSIVPYNRCRAEDGLSSLRYAFTNLVGCIPRDQELGGKASRPLDDEVRACQPRLAEFVKICDPELIVCVGVTARDFLDPKVRHHLVAHRPLHWIGAWGQEKLTNPIKVIDIIHPSAILQAKTAQQGIMANRAAIVILSALQKVFDDERQDEEPIEPV